jgi:hypothetical protein
VIAEPEIVIRHILKAVNQFVVDQQPEECQILKYLKPTQPFGSTRSAEKIIPQYVNIKITGNNQQTKIHNLQQ